MGRSVTRLLLPSREETIGTQKGRVMETDRNGWKRITRTWSCVGTLPKLKSQGGWERGDLGEFMVLFWACTTLLFL